MKKSESRWNNVKKKLAYCINVTKYEMEIKNKKKTT